MKRDEKAEGLLRAYFRERIREERASRKPLQLSPDALAKRSAEHKPSRAVAQGDALKSMFMAAACLLVLASASLAAPRRSYDAGVLHDAAQQLKAQADKIDLFAPFVSETTSNGGTL